MIQIETIKNMSKQEKTILLSLLLCFVNPYVFVAFITIVCIMELKNGLLDQIKTQPGYQALYAFIALSFVVSICSKNIIGALNTLGFLVLFAYAAYYRNYLTKNLITYGLELIVLSSVFVNILGLFQFKVLSNLSGYSFFDFKVQNSPKKRITATYGNANFYAMMIEFVVVCCMARFIQCKEIGKKCFYVGIGIFNIILMYLTGCRAAFMPFVIFVPVFLFLSKEKTWGWISLLCIMLACVAIYFFPNLIPRVSDVSTVSSRIKIWTCALNGLKDHPIFGQGPQAYNLIYQQYGGHKAPHAHNIYLDVLINFGIVGTGILIGYIVKCSKDVMKMRNWKNNPEYFAIAISFVIILMIHGIMDCTINMPCTGFIFLMFINLSAYPYKSEERIVLE